MATKLVYRQDVGVALARPTRRPNGTLRVSGRLARVGVQHYKNADGTARAEFRPPETVFDPAALESFAMAPLTLEHPPVGMLTPENAMRHTIGTVGEDVRRDGAFVTASMIVLDAKAINQLESGGPRELSAGYTVEVVEERGTFDGVPYTHRQVGPLRVNHLAIVAMGRAGAEVAIRMDNLSAPADRDKMVAALRKLGRLLPPVDNNYEAAVAARYRRATQNLTDAEIAEIGGPPRPPMTEAEKAQAAYAERQSNAWREGRKDDAGGRDGTWRMDDDVERAYSERSRLLNDLNNFEE